MYKHRRMRSAILRIFLIASLLCSGSIVTGQSPEIREPAPIPTPYYANPQVNVPSIRKFTFKHAKAADVLKILHQLAGKTDHIGLKIAVDERTNSLVFQPDDDRQTREFEETCALLDAESPPPSFKGPGASVSIPALGPKPLAFDLSFPIVSDESIETHHNRYNELEQKAHQLADKLKQSSSLSESDRIELQQAVRKSFEARQALQRAELADLAGRMKSMQQSIDMRDKLADKVIERRVEDLLNPNLKWDVTRAKTESTHAIAKEDLISPSKITSSQEMQAALQGTWTVRVFQADNQGDDRVSQVVIRDDLLLVHTIVNGKVLGVSPWKLVWPNAEMPYKIGAIWDPNTNTESEPFMPGRIAYDGKSFQLAFGEENPTAICPGEDITYIDCVRAINEDRSTVTQAPSSISTNKLGAADLSTPQATLDYLHRYSLANPEGFPFECYSNEAILELSGMMLQNLSMMSAMSQIALQTGGVIGESNGAPVVSDTSPAFHLLVEALLNEQMLPSPPGSADKAFETLATLTFGSTSSNLTASAQVDRQLLRLAAGVLKSPREFLPAASKLLETLGQTDLDVTKSKEADQTKPKVDVAIIGDEARATFTSSGNDASPSPLSAPRITKLRRIDGRWLISEILSDEEIAQMQSSYSSMMDQFGGAEEVKSDKSKTSDSSIKNENRAAPVDAASANRSQPSTNPPAKFDTPQALLARVDECCKAGTYEEFLALFSDEGIRDLAVAMLMSAVMQSSMEKLAQQQTAGGLKEIDPGTLAIRKVLQRWLPQGVTTAQQEAMGKGLSTMMSSLGGASPDQAALKEFVISMRESVVGISDHRKFCIEIMQAFEKLTSSKFVFFGNADHENEWQISQFGDRTIATLIDGSPGMATTITLQQASGTWSISSLFNELVIEAQPTTMPPSSTTPKPSTAKTVTRRYSVGSFVTESFFAGKGNAEPKEVYDKYETEIEQFMQDLAKTVTAACTQPPKFVQVVSSTRSLLIGHNEAGHTEIADFMRDIGINNDRIRLRGASVEITQDEAKSLGIELAQHVLSVDESKKLNEFATGEVAKRRKFENKAKSGYLYIDFVAMDESIYSGTRIPIKQVGAPIALSIAARISPATRQIQIRFDMPIGEGNEQGFASQFQTLTDGKSVLFEIGDDSYWLVTADIVAESTGSSSGHSIDSGAETNSTSGPKYSGQAISWWLDSYWDNAMAIPKTSENIAQEYVASEAIRKLREKPESDAAIEAALAKWFASVEHEVNEIQLTRAAKCIVTIAGPSHQETAVNFLFKIWKRMPLLTHEQLVEAADDASELNQLLSQLMLNDQLADQFADRLTNGNSTDRSLVVYGLLSLMGRFGIEANKDLTELENWLRKHAERLAPAIEAASKDANEHIRFIALIQLATLIHATKLDPESVRLPTILLAAASDASPDVRYLAIDLLTSEEFASAIKSQNAQITSMLISAVESDSSIDVRYSALNALMHMNVEAELVHKTLMEWAKSDEHEKVKYALDLTLRNYQAGDRPQSIDELIELLSDPEWGTKVEVNYNNWSTHHRWARQYAFAILERYGAHAHRALPTLEAEVARNNKDTLSFVTQALDSVRGYCPDRPIEKLQGQWEFVSIEKPEGSSPFFDFQASSDQQPASVITISGTQLKLGDRVLAEISHYRSGSRQGVQLLIDPNGKKLHCSGRYDFNTEYLISSSSKLEWMKLEFRELLNESNAMEKSKQVYEFRPLKTEAR